jgi:3-phosphoshikimate 1-carboxyvinyltransferase
MPLPDLLPIQPFTRPARGEAIVPGSKSLTNRALLLAAMCEQPVTLTGALFSEDTHLMIEALRKLGFAVAADEPTQTLQVANQEQGFKVHEADLFVGLAGTAARFLTALCAAAPQGVYRLDGVPQMRKRPMAGLIEALRQLGADIRCTGAEGFFPVEIHARGLRGGNVAIDASESSQMLSALLMVAPLAARPVTVQLSQAVRWPFVRMTMAMMAEFGYGVPNQAAAASFSIATGRYRSPGIHPIEPDATAASYYLALPLAVGGAMYLPGLRPPGGGLQGDTRFMDVLTRVGMSIEPRCGESPGNAGPGMPAQCSGVSAACASDGGRRGIEQDFTEFSDTFLTLAALAPLLAGPTRITGIAHSRKQETDRVAGMARELTKLGQHVVETEDSLTITPRPLVAGQTIETYGDHRFAMSFGILGCHDLRRDGEPWLTIRNPACCAKTFPHFFDLLEAVRKKSFSS